MKRLLLTLVLGIPQRVIVERGNFVLGVFTDGWICYGQREPKHVDGHRAIASPVIVIKQAVKNANDTKVAPQESRSDIVRSGVINIPRRCEACSSKDLREFSGELAVHFAGIEGLSKAIVWIFPEVSVCMSCGVAQFHVPDRELRVLRTGIPVDGAAVLMENDEKHYGGRVVDIDDAAGSRPSEI